VGAGREGLVPGRPPGADGRELGPLGGIGRLEPGGGGMGRPVRERGGGGMGLPDELTGRGAPALRSA